MYIKTLHIKDFKSIKDLEINLDKQISILTGVNNSGKTTILEALALWVECFEKLLKFAQRAVTGRYKKGDYILGPTYNKYFNFDEINSVRCPDFDDLFRDRNVKLPIIIEAVVVSEEKRQEISLGFSISNSTNTRYVISLINEKSFDYNKFNTFFDYLNNGSISSYYASPVAYIEQREDFVTEPNLKDNIRKRQSYRIIRNRIYKLYHTARFNKFQEDLSFVLYGSTSYANIRFINRSDINKDKRIVINYVNADDNVEKDIALLGSGTLQVIEILLDVYHQVDEKKDLNLVLLDEPDSHIHRDIQERLLQILSNSFLNNQVIITTHNESLIRAASLTQLFHIDGSGQGTVNCLYKKELPKLNSPHFTGPYPVLPTPVIRSIDSTAAGLDFISAIEADKIIFVEGDDDARLLHKLFSMDVAHHDTKIMFWVLGGISKILDKVDMYKVFFSEIKNTKSLWEKSLLIFDRDRLIDEHCTELINSLKTKKHIDGFALPVYTQESVFISDIRVLSILLMRCLKLSNITAPQMEEALQDAIEKQIVEIKSRYEDKEIDNEFVQSYKGCYLDKIEKISGKKIKTNDIDLQTKLKAFYNNQAPEKLADKNDVITIIQEALDKLNINKTIDESIFYALVENSDRSTIYDSWNQLIRSMEK